MATIPRQENKAAPSRRRQRAGFRRKPARCNESGVESIVVAMGRCERSEVSFRGGRRAAQTAEGIVVANFSLPKSEDSFRVSRKIATRWRRSASAFREVMWRHRSVLTTPLISRTARHHGAAEKAAVLNTTGPLLSRKISQLLHANGDEAFGGKLLKSNSSE